MSEDKTNSFFYPVSFSRDKKEDEVPQLSDQEELHLIALARDRKVILTDEDTCTGDTIGEATRFFEEVFSKEVIPVVNVDDDACLENPEDPRYLLGRKALRNKFIERDMEPSKIKEMLG